MKGLRNYLARSVDVNILEYSFGPPLSHQGMDPFNVWIVKKVCKGVPAWSGSNAKNPSPFNVPRDHERGGGC